MGFNHDDLRSDDDTDIGMLWQEALVKYHEECGTDLLAMPLSRRNLTHIKAEQDRQLLIFSEYRHDKGKLDRLRSLISTNSDIVLGVASHIANAASSAFPPSSALLTAFNYVMNASRAVSEDYDMIVSFFDIMNSFLERISLLESRKPSERQFNRFLINVFSAMMTLSAIARKCRMKGRLRKWAKALIDGSDPNLKGAFDALHMHLQRFESVVMLTTLKYTLESGKKLDALGQDIKIIQDGVERNIMLTEDAATTSHEILTVVTRQEERGAEYTAGLHQVMKTLNKMSRPKDAPNQLVDAGARKSIAMRILDGAFDYFPEEKGGLADFESYYTKGTCDWFLEQDVYMGIERGTVRLLWISGPTGMGKSTLAYTVAKTLQEEFIDDTTVSVAYYFFMEDDWRRHVTQMLQSCVMQIAGRDTSYREQAVAEVQMWDKLREHRQASGSLRLNNDKMWELLYRTKFSNKAGRRLILVLDGVDEVVKEDYPFIDMILEEVATLEDLNIQVILTSESRGLKPRPKSSGAEVFELTKELIMPDIQTIIMDRLKRVERLRELSQRVKRRIVTKLSTKADTMRYVDHILRRLEQLGRERAVLRELDNHLPGSTDKLYEMLLNDCQKGRTDQEIVVLRQFFAWLAYTTDVLTIGSANKLLRYISKDTTIDVDEEVEEGCSRILGLTRTGLTGGGQDDSDTRTEDLDDEALNEATYGDIEEYLLVVGFQEKGLRNYFRPSETSAGDKLRMTESAGHVAVIRIIESILCTEIHRWGDVREQILRGYASTGWHRHLRAIDREMLTQDERATVADSIYRILSNRGGSLKKPERHYSASDTRERLPCVFGDTDEEVEATLSCLQEWALSLTQTSSSLVSDATLGWLQQVARNPKELFIQVAEIHVRNWFEGVELEDDMEIANPFLLAHYALYQAKSLPALQQNEKLTGYLSRCGNNGVIDRYTWDPEPYIVVSSAFPNIDITAQSYLSVALSLIQVQIYEPALEQLQLAIPLATTDPELMEIYERMAEVLVRGALDAKRIQSRPTNPSKDTNEATLEGGSETSDSVDSAHKDPNQEKYDEWASRALHAATKAADIALKLTETAMEESNVRELVGNVWMYKATAELMSGDAANTIAYCQRAAKALKHSSIYWDFNVINLLAESRHWTTLLGVIDTFLTERGTGFSGFMQVYRDAIHKAARATGKIKYVLEQYEDTISSRYKMNWDDGGLLIGYARFCHDVVATAKGKSKAKELLDKVIEARGSAEDITEAFFCLSDILLEEFRHATLGEEKRAAYDKMQDVVRRVTESMGAEFDPTQSQTVIPLAHMARKMDAIEFQEGMERTFQGCVAALMDETGVNDRLSLRMLARVLAVMGLERDAQIAATSQVYVLNMDIYRREQSFEPPESDDDGSDLDGSETVDEDAATSSDPVADGDIYWRNGDVCCADCKEDWMQWSESYPMYLCYYCAELELCQKCFDKRAKRIAGEPSDDWRVFCPEGHKHLRLPVEGWQGISEGVLCLGKGEKVPFTEWLEEIKEKKWPEAWAKFWSEER